VLVVVVFVVAYWVGEAAHRSPYPLPELPEYTVPCVPGWWHLSTVAVEIADGSTRAACLSLPKSAIIRQQAKRWVELDLKRLDSDCASGLPSARVRVEPWQSGKIPQASFTNPAWDSDFPDYLRFPSGMGAAGTEVFVPRDTSSGPRYISCIIGADTCWAAPRDDRLLVRWPTQRPRLVAGLKQDWGCIQKILEAARLE
jgi:hypothetical protein